MLKDAVRKGAGENGRKVVVERGEIARQSAEQLQIRLFVVTNAKTVVAAPVGAAVNYGA